MITTIIIITPYLCLYFKYRVIIKHNYKIIKFWLYLLSIFSSKHLLYYICLNAIIYIMRHIFVYNFVRTVLNLIIHKITSKFINNFCDKL